MLLSKLPKGAKIMPTLPPKPDFVDIRLTGGDFLHSIRWANVEEIVDFTVDEYNQPSTEPYFELYMAGGKFYTVKDPNSFEAIRDRRKDSH